MVAASSRLQKIVVACVVAAGLTLTLQAAEPQTDPVKEAQSLKKLGDNYVSKDEVRAAADTYEQALALARNHFTPDDCVRMAVILSWDDRLSSAIRELRFVLERDPENRNARIHLARIYSWDGQLTRAVSIADSLLSDSPDDKETLLVKANALEWDDRFNDAIPLYEGIISRDGDFDARVGLASSLLYNGNRTEAQRQAQTLVAADARQRRQLQRLSDAIDREMKPRVEIGYDYYSDSDENHYGRYVARYSLAAGNHDFAVNLGRTGAGESTSADDLAFQADFNASGALGLAAGLGVTRLHAPDDAQFPTGYLRLHGHSRKTLFRATMSSEVLAETSELIAHHIRRLSAGGEITQRITPSWSVSGAYSRMRFSDVNQANDAQVRAEFTTRQAPRVGLAYQLRFLDYDRQSANGYFEPDNFLSHRFSASVNVERRTYFTFVQVYGGHQRFERFGYRTSEWVKGVRGSFGFNISTDAAISLNIAAGDSSTGSITGYSYFTAGTKLSYRF